MARHQLWCLIELMRLISPTYRKCKNVVFGIIDNRGSAPAAHRQTIYEILAKVRMDGLSGVASIFAVISLALQLASTAQDIKNFISSIQDAPKELDRLANQLDQFSKIASSIKIVLERQEELGFDVNSDIRQNIFSALQLCNQEMLKMGDLVEKARKLESGQTKLSRTWSSIRLALKKEYIEKLEAKLAQSIPALGVSLTLNLTWVTISKTTITELASSNLSTKTQPTANLHFYDLTSETHHLVTASESYWRHLTVDALKIYAEIYEACKDENENVSFYTFQRQFRAPDPTPVTLASLWLRLKHSIDDIMPKNYTLALLYMLHVEKYLKETPKDDFGGVGVAKKRRKSLKRFGDWVDCACDLKCGSTWNFANDLGLSQTVFPGRACKVHQWLEKDEQHRSIDLKGSYDYHLTLKRWTGL